MAKKRLQFDYTAEQVKQLDRLVSTYNATSRAELIRRATGLFEKIMKATSNGSKLVVIAPDGTEREVWLL